MGKPPALTRRGLFWWWSRPWKNSIFSGVIRSKKKVVLDEPKSVQAAARKRLESGHHIRK